jgi:thioesterase domain-containing protein
MPDISGDFTVETLLGFAGTDNSEDTSRNPSVADNDSGFASPPSSMTSSMPSPTTTAKPALPQSLQTGSKDVPPMYLFHDGSGTVGMYSRLSQMGCNLFGVANPGFGESEHWAKSITDIAANYAASIAKSVEKSVVLGGWSFGGVVAFETAQHLRRLGKDVKGVILIDSPCPKDHQPLPQEVVRHILKPMTANNNAASQKSAASVATQFEQHARMLGQYQPPKDTSDIPYVMLQSELTFDTSGQCGVKYPWLEDQRARSQAIDGWQELLGRKVKTLKIPGDHFQPFTPECIGDVSEKLKEAYTLVSGAK